MSRAGPWRTRPVPAPAIGDPGRAGERVTPLGLPADHLRPVGQDEGRSGSPRPRRGRSPCRRRRARRRGPWRSRAVAKPSSQLRPPGPRAAGPGGYLGAGQTVPHLDQHRRVEDIWRALCPIRSRRCAPGCPGARSRAGCTCSAVRSRARTAGAPSPAPTGCRCPACGWRLVGLRPVGREQRPVYPVLGHELRRLVRQGLGLCGVTLSSSAFASSLRTRSSSLLDASVFNCSPPRRLGAFEYRSTR